ncbi:MAG: hypothetical protein IT506_04140 [Aquabacterium sp.]|nr:hypothetical protein [Aquabacterium sp.]
MHDEHDLDQNARQTFPLREAWQRTNTMDRAMHESIEITLPDLDEVSRQARERFERAKREVARDGRFIGVSLGQWLSHVGTAGVAHVPAKKIFSIGRDVWLYAEEGRGADVATWEKFSLVLSSQPDGVMVRLDPCSGEDIKYPMSTGQLPDFTQRKTLNPFDYRASEIVYEFPGDDIDVWARPWIEAKIHDDFPVEFRVFVRNSEVLGVASYYPQRPLPDTAQMLGYAEQCRLSAQAITDHLNVVGATPWMPNYEGRFEDGKVSATMDFIISTDGKPVFLEAGPPYGAGAHPCAFIEREITGVALALADGVRLR